MTTTPTTPTVTPITLSEFKSLIAAHSGYVMTKGGAAIWASHFDKTTRMSIGPEHAEILRLTNDGMWVEQLPCNKVPIDHTGPVLERRSEELAALFGRFIELDIRSLNIIINQHRGLTRQTDLRERAERISSGVVDDMEALARAIAHSEELDSLGACMEGRAQFIDEHVPFVDSDDLDNSHLVVGWANVPLLKQADWDASHYDDILEDISGDFYDSNPTKAEATAGTLLKYAEAMNSQGHALLKEMGYGEDLVGALNDLNAMKRDQDAKVVAATTELNA